MLAGLASVAKFDKITTEFDGDKFDNSTAAATATNAAGDATGEAHTTPTDSSSSVASSSASSSTFVAVASDFVGGRWIEKR
jgi:hypothetical protein